LVTYPITDQRCLTSAIARRCDAATALTAGPSSSSNAITNYKIQIKGRYL
jgi:hypothetical protein